MGLQRALSSFSRDSMRITCEMLAEGCLFTMSSCGRGQREQALTSLFWRHQSYSWKHRLHDWNTSHKPHPLMTLYWVLGFQPTNEDAMTQTFSSCCTKKKGWLWDQVDYTTGAFCKPRALEKNIWDEEHCKAHQEWNECGDGCMGCWQYFTVLLWKKNKTKQKHYFINWAGNHIAWSWISSPSLNAYVSSRK